MLKKSFAFCLLGLTLVFGADSASAQKEGGFSIKVPTGQVEAIDASKLPDLPDAGKLSQEELEAALQNNSCGGPQQIGDAAHCEAWTGPFCTGTGFYIPCGYQITPGPFGSLSTGCTTTYGRLSSTNQLYQFVGFALGTCITPNNGDTFNLVACTTP